METTTKDKNIYLDIVRFAALLNTSLVYLDYIYDDMVRLFVENQRAKINYDSLNRQQKSKIDKSLIDEEKKYRANLQSLQKKLEKFASMFENDKRYGFIFDNMVDSLHESLRNVDFTAKDDFRKIYLNKLSSIKTTNRSDSELTRLSALLDNFITLNINR